MTSTFVIGIGYTGIKVMLHLKKILLDQSPTVSLPPNFKLLGLDTCTRPDEVKGVSLPSEGGSGATGVASQSRRQNKKYTGLVSEDEKWFIEIILKIPVARIMKNELVV